MKNKLYVLKSYFSKGELLLWSASALFVLLSFAVFDGENYLILLWSMAALSRLPPISHFCLSKSNDTSKPPLLLNNQ